MGSFGVILPPIPSIPSHHPPPITHRPSHLFTYCPPPTAHFNTNVHTFSLSLSLLSPLLSSPSSPSSPLPVLLNKKKKVNPFARQKKKKKGNPPPPPKKKKKKKS